MVMDQFHSHHHLLTGLLFYSERFLSITMNWIHWMVILGFLPVTIFAEEIQLNHTRRGHFGPRPHYGYSQVAKSNIVYHGDDPNQCCCGVRQRPYEGDPYHKGGGGGERYGGYEERLSHQNEFTWVATLHFAFALLFSGLEESLVCGGSLLNERYILTSGICCLPFLGAPYFLVANLGNHDLHLDSDIYEHFFLVWNCYIHYKFDYDTLDYNLALVELHRSVVFTDYILPICLPPSHLHLTGKNVLSFGWTTEANSYEVTNIDPDLKNGYVQVIPEHQCQAIYNGSWTITSNMICARQRYRAHKACNYDFGMSLAYDCGDHYTIVGVMSHPYLCGWPKVPPIYADVGAVLRDIKEFLGYTTCSTYCYGPSATHYGNGNYRGHYEDAPLSAASKSATSQNTSDCNKNDAEEHNRPTFVDRDPSKAFQSNLGSRQNWLQNARGNVKLRLGKTS